MNIRWESRWVPLKFHVGDKALFSIKLRLQVREIGLSEEAPPVSLPIPPTDALAADCQGYLLRSLPITAPLPILRRVPGYLCYTLSQYPRYYIELQGTFDQYKQKFSSKTRSTITRKIKKYTEHCGGALIWKAYKTPPEMNAFYQLARAISSKTYQEKLLDVGLPAAEEFRRHMEQLAHEDQVRGYILFDGEQAVSYLYCPAKNGVLQYQFLGYDPAYASWSVGTVLQWLALENLFAEGGFRRFDFTEGQSEHKRLFGTDNVYCANVLFLRASGRHILLVRCHQGFNAFSQYSGQVLERLGLKSKIKKLIRFGKR